MARRSLLLAAVVAAIAAAPSGGAAASTTVRLAIAHVVSHCHVWKTATAMLGPSTRITVRRGARLVVRSDCPMDFDLAQTKGPPVALGRPRMYAGTARVLVFRAPGTYRFTAKNVQTPEERGLVTLGDANILTLTVVVRAG
jgi:hypothetical protein